MARLEISGGAGRRFDESPRAFASTYEDHTRNVQRWRAIERQRAAGGR